MLLRARRRPRSDRAMHPLRARERLSRDHAVDAKLLAARGFYQAAGFCRVKEEPHHSFGVDLVGETWEMKL